MFTNSCQLKVLSSEMDPVEIRLIRKVFIKGRGAEVVRKIRPSPILREPFKDIAPSCSVFVYYDPNLQCNDAHISSCVFCFAS
jgi:hypothetical protein